MYYKYCWKLKLHQSQLWSVWLRLVIENAIIALCVLTSAEKEQFAVMNVDAGRTLIAWGIVKACWMYMLSSLIVVIEFCLRTELRLGEVIMY